MIFDARRWSGFTLLGLLSVAPHARADLPAFLRTENREVVSGNQALTKGDAKGALESYNQAARKLPDAPGVQLDRGLALLKQGDYGKAREALLSATVPNASSDVRADAYHDLSLSFYREADGLAGQDKHAEAQKLFREAVDAAKRSLHLRPDDPNAAWNLELAARRVREEAQKQKDQEQKDKDDKEKQKQDDQDKKSDDQKSDPQDQDQKDQDQKDQDQKDQQPSDQDKKPDDQQQKPEPQKQPDADKQEQQQQPDADNKEQAAEKQLPKEAEQALDSLKDGEENFERYRARQRASRERRAPEKDW